MKRLRGTDAYAIYSETPTSPFNTLKVAIYRPTRSQDNPTTDEIRAFIRNNIFTVGGARAALRILRVPLDLHHPVWVRAPGFSPDDHILDVELPAPGTKEQLCDFLSELMSRPLDCQRPLWEVWVIRGLEKGRVAIAFKVQHALADGRAMARMILASHATSPDGAPAGGPQGQDIAEEPVPGKAQLAAGALVDLARSYTVELPRFRQYLKEARRRGAAIEEQADKLVAPFSAPHTLLNARAGGAERIYRYESFPLADIKALARVFACTINALVMGICSEALKRYLEEVDAMPEESLIAAMPVGDGVESGLEEMLGSDIHNNNLAVAILPLHQHVADFQARLRAISESARAAIDHVRHDEGSRFDNYLDFLPGTAVRLINASMYRRQRKRQNPHANVVISNVAGPRQALYALDGRLKMEELLSVGNLMDTGHLNITVWSYMDRFAFSFFMRKDALPRPERIRELVREVIGELQASYLADAEAAV